MVSKVDGELPTKTVTRSSGNIIWTEEMVDWEKLEE